MKSQILFSTFFLLLFGWLICTIMGRHRKYHTEEELIIARKKRQMKYYWKNVRKKRKEALKRYYESKRNIQDNQQN